MSTSHRIPVYKCIIPVEQPRSVWSSIYRSIFHRPGEKGQRLPYPAWPYIDQATKRPPATSWWVQKLSADLTAD
jgi:hypothetical protein